MTICGLVCQKGSSLWDGCCYAVCLQGCWGEFNTVLVVGNQAVPASLGRLVGWPVGVLSWWDLAVAMVGVSASAREVALPAPTAGPGLAVKMVLGIGPVALGWPGSGDWGEVGPWHHRLGDEISGVLCTWLCSGADCCNCSTLDCRLGIGSWSGDSYICGWVVRASWCMDNEEAVAAIREVRLAYPFILAF